MLPLLTGPAHFISNLKRKFPTCKTKAQQRLDPALLEGSLATTHHLLDEALALLQGPCSHTDHAYKENSVQTLSLFCLFVLVPFVGWHWKLPRWLTLNPILIFLGYPTVLSKHFLDCSITIHSVVNHIFHCIVVVFVQAYLL